MAHYAELNLEAWVAKEIEKASPPLSDEEVELLRDVALDKYADGDFAHLMDLRRSND